MLAAKDHIGFTGEGVAVGGGVVGSHQQVIKAIAVEIASSTDRSTAVVK